MKGKVSVLMGVYNCADTLEQAVASIRSQTYENWELILCDDGSTDETWQVVQRLASQDSRIVLLQNEKNLGLNQTLNRCLTLATGEFIARMDGDDESLPQRFGNQVALLEGNPQIHITSGPMFLFDGSGQWGRTHVPEYPTPEQVVCGTPISHAPVMLRRSCLEAVGGYSEDPATLRVEDVDLWIRLYAAGFRCRNLTEPAYRMRNDQNAYQRRKYIYRINSARVRLRGCKTMHLSPGCYLKACTPLLIGLVPGKLRRAVKGILK